MSRRATGAALAVIGALILLAGGALVLWSILPSSHPAGLASGALEVGAGRTSTLRLVVSDASIPLAIRARALAPGVRNAELTLSVGRRGDGVSRTVAPGDPTTGQPMSEVSFPIGRLSSGSYRVGASAQGADVVGRAWVAWESNPSWPASLLTWILVVGTPCWLAVFLVDLWVAASSGAARVKRRHDD